MTKHEKHPIEHLVFQVEDPATIDDFIALDHEIWTSFLSSFEGFISKEMWINTNKPGEIHSVLVWDNMECWKGIELEALKAKTKEFDEAFSGTYEILRRIHKEYDHGLYQVHAYRK